ncbi:MAG: hypothetical protein H0S79_10910 [Anaerolineaceae bacterium]|nr:hypothetical protein [Anaerolineaceae bacterium]
MYDLNLLPIHLENGQPAADRGGFLAVNAPRRAARGRAEDTLIVILNLAGGATVPVDMQQSWLDSLAQAYFKTSGSVTAALRSLIESLNLSLMQKNLKTEGSAVTGAINLAVVHRRSLYLAQSGPSHAFVLNAQGLHHFADTSQTDRGLGFSRMPTVRYYQAEVDNGAFLFTTDDPPPSWAEMHLVTESFPGLEQMRRRLLNQTPPDFRMTLTQMTPGQGRINLIRASVRPTVISREEQAVEPAPPVEEHEEAPFIEEPDAFMVDDRDEADGVYEMEVPELQEEAEPQTADLPDLPQLDEETGPVLRAQPDQPPGQPEPQVESPSTEDTGPVLRPQPQQRLQPTAQPPMSHLRSQQEPDSTQAVRRARPKRDTGIAARETLEKQRAQIETDSLKGLAKGLKSWQRGREKVDTFFKDLIARWSPEGAEGTPTLSKRTLILIAVLIPLVVVGIAAGVYLSRGRNQQYTYYLNQAMAYAEAASLTSDSGSAREAWGQVMTLIDHTESYKETDETAQVRDWAQTSLDTLDGVVRLDYRPALTDDLYSDIEITEIALFNRDLYLLDKTGGRVIHANQRTNGYEVDADFVCAAGNFSGGSIGPLVDMVVLPLQNAFNAHVLAVDAAGNAVYCAAGQAPAVVALPASTGASEEVAAIALSGRDLYVLNRTAGSIRVYSGSNSLFTETPTEYFEGMDLAGIPDIAQVVDIAVNGLDLYLLGDNGLIANCVSSSVANGTVTCENPVAYVDGRTGLEEQLVVMPEGQFTGVTYTGYPEPSVSMMELGTGDIYRFSVRFRLYQRLRPDFGEYEVDESKATAFTLIFDKQLYAFLAYGHQLFFAYVN